MKSTAKMVILALVLGLFAYFVLFKKDTSKIKIEPPLVKTEKAKAIDMADYVSQTGNTVAYNTVDLVARIEGYLDKISFKDGSFVKKDNELFVIQPQPYEEKLNEAKAQVAAAVAGLNYAKAEYARQKRMFQQNATSQNSVEIWLSRQQQAEAELLKAQANLVNAKINYGYTHVKAPFDGRIGRHLVDEGNLVGNGQATKLATIEQIEPIYVYFNLNELDLLKLRKAARKKGIKGRDINDIPVYVGHQNENGYPHQGYLNFIDTGLNPSTGTMEFRAILKNENLVFVPGLFVKVRIPITSEKPLLTVPSTAVLYDQIGAYILTVDKNRTVNQQYVTLGPKEQERQAITKGLTANDDVIIQGLQFATPGNQVRVISNKNKETKS